jgi:hypothetical protein
MGVATAIALRSDLAVGLAWVLGLLPLEVTGASPQPPVYPDQGSGFAAYILGGFFGLGVLIAFAVWTSRRPKRPS